MSHLTNITLKIWRQSGPSDSGRFETHVLPQVSSDASFLEMLDVLNEGL
ncbi:MAG: succinate dehydrogenase/fumarate reductase iron-sulfur subunit, partial [Ilumatobacteraceae bacterium]